VYLHKSLSSKSAGGDQAAHLRIHEQTHTHAHTHTCAQREKGKENERRKEIERERDLIRSFRKRVCVLQYTHKNTHTCIRIMKYAQACIEHAHEHNRSQTQNSTKEEA